MKNAIKATGFTPLNVIKLLQFEVFFGIVWNILWSNLFYSYGSKNQSQQSSQFLEIWVNILIISGFVQALAYLLLINGFVYASSRESPSKDNAVPYLTAILGIIDTISIAMNAIMISIAAGVYMFTDLIIDNNGDNSNLSNIIKAYLGSVFGMILMFVICAMLYILSGAFVRSANNRNGNQLKQNVDLKQEDYQNEHNKEVEQNADSEHRYAAVPQADQDEEGEYDNHSINQR